MTESFDRRRFLKQSAVVAGVVDLTSARFYPMGTAEPLVLSQAAGLSGEPQLQSFYDCIRNGTQPAVNINVAAVAALTAILGHEAIYRKRMLSWQDLGVDVDFA